MTKLIIRLFGYDQAQTVLTRNYYGAYWFMAESICSLLGIAGYSQAVHNNLDSTEWKKKKEYTGTSNRQLLMISESGVYKLIQLARTDQGREAQERARNIAAPLRPECWPDAVTDIAA